MSMRDVSLRTGAPLNHPSLRWLDPYLFSADAAEDFTDGAPDPWTDSLGRSWDLLNYTKASTFALDGTKLDWAQNQSGSLTAGTAPGISLPITNIAALRNVDRLICNTRINLGTSGNFGRFMVGLLNGTTYCAGGVMYVSASGDWEGGGISASSEWSNFGVAVSTETDLVLQTIFTPMGALVYDCGAWSGDWSQYRKFGGGGTGIAAVSAKDISGRTALPTPFDSSSTKLVFATSRTTGTTNAGLIGFDVGYEVSV